MTQNGRLRRRLRTAAFLSIGLFIVLAIQGLAACDSKIAIQSSTSSTQSQPQAQTPYSQVKVQKCGIVQGLEILKVPPSDTGAQQAENCFWHAFQQCLPATLVFLTGSVDTALTRTFTIHNNNGTCSISDVKQMRTVPNAPSPSRIYSCSSLVHKPNGLRFSACGKDGDVIFPGS